MCRLAKQKSNKAHLSNLYPCSEKVEFLTCLSTTVGHKLHHEKILFLHMPKGADNLCNHTGGSEPMFPCYTD